MGYIRLINASWIFQLPLGLTAVIIVLLSHQTIGIAQLVPVPPPSPGSETEQVRPPGAGSDKNPPVIQFLTTELTKGKNVFKLNITDESEIGLREIGYVHDGKINTHTLVYDGNNIYKGLVNVNPPSAVIVVNIDDVYGNKASYAKSIPVKEPPDIISQLFGLLTRK